MRLSGKSSVTKLTTTNFSEWLSDLEVRCGKKGSLSEDQKYYYLLEALNLTDRGLVKNAVEKRRTSAPKVKEESGRDESKEFDSTETLYNLAAKYLEDRYRGTDEARRMKIFALMSDIRTITIRDLETTWRRTTTSSNSC
jgi:hypothetical protein